MNKQFRNKIVIFVAGVCIIGMILNCAAPDKRSMEAEVMANKPVNVTGGLITGYTSQDGHVRIYKGIPYAADTGGQNRFRSPQDVKPWNGIKDCTNWGNSAVQPPQDPFMFWTEEFIISNKIYSEDCLNLNVWTPGTAERKPVIMFIHGGGYTSGGSSCDVYDGEAIARKDVVFVSVNYRAGIFGFLANSQLQTENDGCGNFAVLDLIKALEWIRDNITQFGGDPENVTIMGQSAGSGLVQALVASPRAKNMFHHAVAQSYNAIQSPFKDITAQIEQGDALGISLDDLRSMSTGDVFNLKWASSPCVGTDIIPYDLATAYNKGAANDVDLTSGFVEGDGLLFFRGDAELPADQLEKNMMVSQLALANLPRIPGYKGNVYLYYYNYIMPGENSQSDGAFHTSDVPYFFNHLSGSRASYWTAADRKLANIMSDYLVNFAKTGNPNGAGLAVWRTAEESGSYLLLNADPKMR
ncbi:MAG: carboxylesterase family protein [Treponema sp.]|jgi:para-nitrobenzyl esterase|nr:carboxylesterase family protein [Treponema sp.]